MKRKGGEKVGGRRGKKKNKKERENRFGLFRPGVKARDKMNEEKGGLKERARRMGDSEEAKQSPVEKGGEESSCFHDSICNNARHGRVIHAAYAQRKRVCCRVVWGGLWYCEQNIK